MHTRFKMFAGWALLTTLGWSHSAIKAEPRRSNESWMQRHREFAELARAATDCQILYLGDSITDHWRRKAVAIWDAYYASHGALNFGISGDARSTCSGVCKTAASTSSDQKCWCS